MGRLEAKHWALIIAYLGGIGATIGGLPHWHDITPIVAAGLLAQTATLLGAIFAGAPPNPHTRHNRRRGEGGHVSDHTRRSL